MNASDSPLAVILNVGDTVRLHYETGESASILKGASVELLAAAVSKENIAQYRALLRKAGLKLVLAVPEVLLNGNHALINRWRRNESLKLTRERRPEMLENVPLDKKDRAFLAELEQADAE